MEKKCSYAVYGAFFGALFPIGAIVLDVIVRGLPVTLSGAYTALETQPLHWIISSAPLFLGLFAAIAGTRQDTVLLTAFQAISVQLTVPRVPRVPR